MGLGPTLSQVPWQEKLRRALARRRGARLGEATVVSRQLHGGEPHTPHIAKIITSVDAGHAMYARTLAGEIIHLDVFHAVADVDHRRLAAALRQALPGTLPHGAESDGKLLLDYFDVMTGTGGGRVTGDLSHTGTASVRAAHKNHVHLAGRLPDEQLDVLLAIVIAVEDELRAQGVEPRRIEKLTHENWGKTVPDLSHYQCSGDSWLGGERPPAGAGRGRTQQAAGDGQSLRSSRAPAGAGGWAARAGGGTGGGAGAGAGSGAGAGTGDGAGAGSGAGASGRPGSWPGSWADSGDGPGGGGPGPQGGGPGVGCGPTGRGAGGQTGGAYSDSDGAAPGPGGDLTGRTWRPLPPGTHLPDDAPPVFFPPDSGFNGWDSLADEQRLQSALDLSRRLGSPDELKRVLDELSREQGWAALYGSGSSQAPFIIRQLEDDGLVRRELRGLRLTEAGLALAAYLSRHLRDVKLRFRKLIRRMPGATAKQARKPGPSKAPPSPDVRYGVIRGTAPAEPGAWLGDLAVPETIRSAIKRTHLGRIAAGGPRTRGLSLQRQDVHVYLRSGEQPLNICLLIDASASMAGRRILAAKHLARHLLVSTRDRIAVIAFQERDVRVYVPFTRDYAQVEEGLSRIQPMGLTPLAHGLSQSLDLIRDSRVRRPLLLLITDGIPTVAKWTIDPQSDALEAARHVGQGRIPFGCIGLQPSKRYLEELARAAGGTLHIVEELDEDALVTIAHSERQKTVQRAR